jgi:hypothetical protein
MATFGGANTVTDGLVLSLDAANRNSYTSGSATWNDLSGNNNTGTLTNGPTFNSENGGSIVFDGSGSKRIPITVTPLIQNDFTFISWAKRDGNSSTSIGGIFGNHFHTQFSGANIYFTNTNNTVTMSAGNGLTRPTHTVTIPRTNMEWNCYVIRYTGTTYEFYFNGVLLDSRTAVVVQSLDTNQFIIGVWAASYLSEYYLNGKISQCLSYNRALSASEIQQNYNATKGRFNL